MEEDYFQTYQDMKYLSKNKLEEILNTFQCVRVPLTKKESEFIYFRKYPVENLNQFISPNDTKKESPQTKGLDLNMKNQNQKFGQNKIISYQNPYAEKKLSQNQQFQENSKKIVKSLPPERTLLIVSIDRNYEEQELKDIFQIFGKVRRVFKMKLQKKQAKKKILTKYFFILVYKHEKSLIKCFDTRHFQFELMNKKLPSFALMNENEKEIHFQDYFKSIKDHLDNMEEKEIQVTEGYELAAKTNNSYDKLIEEIRGEKKQKNKIHDNYYQFAAHHNMGEKKTKKKIKFVINEESDLDEGQLENPDYLIMRKKKLEQEFNNLKKIKNNQ